MQQVDTFPVQVAQVPGRSASALAREGDTVASVIGAAGFTSEGFQVRSDGAEVSLDAPVRPGQTIILTQRVKGN